MAGRQYILFMYIHGLKRSLVSPAQPEHISFSVSPGIIPIFMEETIQRRKPSIILGQGNTRDNIAHNRHETERNEWN